jgi:hypothetical protein
MTNLTAKITPAATPSQVKVYDIVVTTPRGTAVPGTAAVLGQARDILLSARLMLALPQSVAVQLAMDVGSVWAREEEEGAEPVTHVFSY